MSAQNDNSIQQLARYLEANDLEYEIHEDEERLLLGIDGVPVIVRYRKEAAVLLITVPNILRAPQDGHGAPTADALTVFLKYLLDVNYKLMVGRFGWDHRDGEVIFEIAIMCADSPLTSDQFMSNLVLAVQTVSKRYPQLQRALWSGLSLEQLISSDDENRGPMLPQTGHA